MDDLDTEIPKSRTGLVVALVVVGLGILGVGGFLAWSKRGGGGGGEGGGAAPKSVAKWCELRQEWARKVKPLAGDIMLASAREDQAEEREKLEKKRNALSAEYATKVKALLEGDPKLWTAVKEVEEALIAEGSSRANRAVEIHNTRVKRTATTSEELLKYKGMLEGELKEKIAAEKAKADQAVNAAMAKLGDQACQGIYRGPMVAGKTSASPYISWDELGMSRTLAIKAFDEAIKAIEPLEQFTNRVRHDLMARHTGLLKHCYDRIKAKNPEMSDKMGLQIRLKKNGQVQTLGVAWMVNKDERIVDCFLEKAAKWRLPRPESEEFEVVVVSLDFSAM